MNNMYIVSTFTDKKTQGNPAGVIMDSENLSNEQKKLIVGKTGYSECAFVEKTNIDKTVTVKFFSKNGEVGFCGHALLAAAHVLGKEYTIETASGTINPIFQEDGIIDIAYPELIGCTDVLLESAHRIIGSHVRHNLVVGTPVIIQVGKSKKIIIQVKSFDVLVKMQLYEEQLVNYNKTSGSRGVYVFATCPTPEAEYAARSFNPLMGILEDPTTGIGAAMVAYYLKTPFCSIKMRNQSFKIAQGWSVRRPGRIHIRYEGDNVIIGGKAVTVKEKLV